MSKRKKEAEKELPRKRLENIYVAIDACAELGGQPYKVLEALHDLYAVTGRRNLTLVDTEQGFHEKSNGTTPDIFKATGAAASIYGKFVMAHPDWVKIIPTETCVEFKDRLAGEVFPLMVTPMIKTVEEASEKIREEAFKILKNRGQATLMGKEINSPSDIEIQVQFTGMEKGDKGGHYVFRNEILSAAADAVMPFWKEQMEENPSLSRGDKTKNHKGHMAAMVKAVQEVKAYSHMLLQQFDPALADSMGAAPVPPAEDGLSLATLRDSSHLYDRMTLPEDKEFLRKPEFIQAVRLTQLWPWAQKPMLKKSSIELLRTIHKNTADVSYLHLFANEMHKHSAPENTFFVLVTHDAPLIEEFMECSTGVTHHREKVRERKHEPKVKRDVYKASDIHDRLGLNKDTSLYPTEAPWTGEEFVAFAYKETLAALNGYIAPDTRREIYDDIRSSRPKDRRPVGSRLRKEIEGAYGVPPELKQALTNAVTQTEALEMFTSRDIEGHGRATEFGKYHHQKERREEARGRIER